MRWIFALVLLAIACDHSPADPPVGPIRLLDESLYAGTELKLVGANLGTLADVTTYADTMVLPAVRRNGDTVVVQVLPALHGDVQIRIGKDRTPVDWLHVRGFVGLRTLPVSAVEWHVFPGGGGKAAVVGGNHGLWEVSLGTNTARLLLPRDTYPLDWSQQQQMPGFTHHDGVLLMQPLSGPIEAWQLAPTAQRLSTYPTRTSRVLHQLSDSIFLTAYGQHTMGTLRLRNGSFEQIVGSLFGVHYEELVQLIMSPRRDLATTVLHYAPEGVPIYNTATGDTVYHVRGYHYYPGVAFSATGDTLWMLGYNSNETSLLALAATTGQELRRITWPFTQGIALAIDPDQARVLVALDDSTGLLHLRALDPSDFRIVWDAAAPAGGTWADVMAVDAYGIFLVGWDRLLQFDY